MVRRGAGVRVCGGEEPGSCLLLSLSLYHAHTQNPVGTKSFFFPNNHGCFTFSLVFHSELTQKGSSYLYKICISFLTSVSLLKLRTLLKIAFKHTS